MGGLAGTKSDDLDGGPPGAVFFKDTKKMNKASHAGGSIYDFVENCGVLHCLTFCDWCHGQVCLSIAFPVTFSCHSLI